MPPETATPRRVSVTAVTSGSDRSAASPRASTPGGAGSSPPAPTGSTNW
ncbi:hypothetical protein [Herbidospora daliensis]|nr:hypothetical protein [Herbidospora daliensis]